MTIIVEIGILTEKPIKNLDEIAKAMEAKHFYGKNRFPDHAKLVIYQIDQSKLIKP